MKESSSDIDVELDVWELRFHLTSFHNSSIFSHKQILPCVVTFFDNFFLLA